MLTSDGFPTPSPELVAAWLERTHAAGGLWIADEVQGGHGRTGTAMWSFERLGITPGPRHAGQADGQRPPDRRGHHPARDRRAFADETVFFSTFGGNPVSAAAARAVLDVIADERILERVTAAGDGAAGRHPGSSPRARTGHRRCPRGRPGHRRRVRATPPTATAVKEGLRERGVLVGTTGRDGNVLKVRPPLAFTTAEVPVFADALEATLAGDARPS